ncbi:hypothetical protein [Zhaonella formicivorans]|uniref:hypothetical protein n=1 Tax=Zhaonella formicivorans TaxID=2528593 RepID=UPI0010EFD092|nr:hypothetical protein [Zhaonella formicivorans]
MKTVYLGDEAFISLEDEEIQPFLTACSAVSISYQHKNDRIEIFPPLRDNTIVIKPLDNGVILNKFVEKLRLTLAEHAALVIIEPGPRLNPGLLKVLKAQIAIGLAEQRKSKNNAEIRFYYSLKRREESLRFIAGLIKQFCKNNLSFTTELASYFEHLTCSKYRKIIFSDVPTVLAEFSSVEVMENFLEGLTKCFVQNIICTYGQEVSSEELKRLGECLTVVKKTKKKTCEDTPEIANVTSEAVAIPSPEPELPISSVDNWDIAKNCTVTETQSAEITSALTMETSPSAANDFPAPSPEPAAEMSATGDKNVKASQLTETVQRKKKRKSAFFNPLISLGEGPVYTFIRNSQPSIQPTYILEYLKNNAMQSSNVTQGFFRANNEKNRHAAVSRFNREADKLLNDTPLPKKQTLGSKSTFHSNLFSDMASPNNSNNSHHAGESNGNPINSPAAHIDRVKELAQVLEG